MNVPLSLVPTQAPAHQTSADGILDAMGFLLKEALAAGLPITAHAIALAVEVLRYEVGQRLS